jgi:serine/threonine protein kinase
MSESLEPLYFGNYEVLQRPGGGHWLLGEGGYGRTYKAVHRFLQRECALKIIHERHMRNERQRARFLHEAQTAARLSHRGIAHVYDFGEHDGVFFYAMEFCQGGNLDELSKRRGPMPWPEVADFARQIGDALACAHGAGLLHRDLKPQNVMLASKNRPHIAKLIDFGLVKVLPTVENDSTWAIQSVEGGFKGNYATASPEQTGEEEDLDERSDLFSFGVILWWMLVGHNPFEGMSNPRLIADRLSPESYEPRLPKELDDSARGVLGKLLEKRPENRFATARELLVALGELEGTARPAPGPPRESDETTEMSPADLPPEPVSGRPSFEDSFEVVSTLEDLLAAKFYGCLDGAGDSYSALIPESDAAESGHAGLRRLGQEGARLPCLDYFGTWQAEDKKPVFVFGPVGPLRLLEVLKMVGSARLLDLAPMLGRLARSIEQADRELGVGLELNPHTLRVAASGGVNEPRSWADIDPLSLRTVPSLPGSGEDSADVSDASTIVTEESMFPLVSQFSALIYRLVSGTAVKHSAYFSSAAYVPAAALSEDGNQLLRSLICGEGGEPSVLQVIRDLAPLEGLSVEFFGLDDEDEALREPLPVPIPVVEAKARLEEVARAEAEKKAKQEAERKLREKAERKAREEAEKKARQEAERKAKEEAERKAKEEAERKVREEAERKVREEAERKAKAEAEKKAEEDAKLKAKEDAERKVREEAERKEKAEADKKAAAAAALKAKQDAKRKAEEEAARKAQQEEAERKAREEAERKAKEEAERKSREEAERKAKEEARRKAKEEAEKKKREQAERKANEKAERAAKAAAAKKAREEAKIAKQAAMAAAKEKAREEARLKHEEEREQREASRQAGALQPVPAEAPAQAKPGKKAGKPLGLMIGGGVAALLAIVIGLSFVFKDKGGNGGGNGSGNGGNGGDPNGGGGTGQVVKFTQLEKLRLSPGLRPEDLDIRAKSADTGEFVSARWRTGSQQAFFDGKISGVVTVTLRDGLVFEDRWSEGSSIVNQLEGTPDALTLGEVRQVFGVPLPGVLRDPDGEAEPVRKDWLTLERDGTELPFILVEGDDPVKRRALWLGLIPNSTLGESDYAPQAPASVAAAPMPAGMELVLVVPGYRKLTRSPGKPLPDPIELRPAAVSLMVKTSGSTGAGYPYRSVVLKADEPGARKPETIPAEVLRQGRQVPLRSGNYRVEFRGTGTSGDDDLLANAMMVIPPDCPDEGQLLLPAALPGLEVRIDGERIDYRTLGFEPDEAGGAPPDLQLGASGLEVKWADIAVKPDQFAKELDLAALRDSDNRTARVLLPASVCAIKPADSLLPAELLPDLGERDVSAPAKVADPLVIKAKFSGVYRASNELGIELHPLPEDLELAGDIDFDMEERPVVEWWHNLRLSLPLPVFAAAVKKEFGYEFPTSTIYSETELDLSGGRPHLFFYCFNQVNGWSASWGTLRIDKFEADGKGACRMDEVVFLPKWEKFYQTDGPSLRFALGPGAGRGLPYKEMVRKAGQQKRFRPWWPLYPDWRRDAPDIIERPVEGAAMKLCLRSKAANVQLEMEGMREFFQPNEAGWTSDTLQLKPDGKRDEIYEALGEKFQGKIEVGLFEGVRVLAPATALTPDLWGFLETE